MLTINDIKLNNCNLITFDLDKESDIDFSETITVDDENDKVSIFNKSKMIVVYPMNDEIIKEENIHVYYKVVERFLDLVTMTKNITYCINQSESYIISNKINGSQDVLVTGIITQQFKATIKAILTDMDGNEIISPKKTILIKDFMRYYRMSKGSDYLVDAYKYLYLSFESAMAEIVKRRRREDQWLERVFTYLNNKYDIDGYFRKDMHEHFHHNQYKGVRVKLFHAKEDIIKPLDYLEMKELYNAYIDLNDICKFIFDKEFNITTGGGFVLGEATVSRMHGALKVNYIKTDCEKKTRKAFIANFEAIDKEMRSIYEVELIDLNDLKFKELSFLNENKEVTIVCNFNEKIELTNISKLTYKLTLVYLNKTVYDKKFKDYQLN